MCEVKEKSSACRPAKHPTSLLCAREWSLDRQKPTRHMQFCVTAVPAQLELFCKEAGRFHRTVNTAHLPP